MVTSNVTYIFVVLYTFASSLSCSLTRKSEKKDSPKSVHLDWQVECQKEADRLNSPMSWCLTSTSGYVDDGQIFVFGGEKSGKIDALVPGKNRDYDKQPSYESLIDRSKVLKKDVWVQLKAVLESSRKLKSYDSKAFDGIQYRYLEIRFENGKKTQHVIEMNNPEVAPDKESPDEAMNRKGILDLISTLKKASQ